MNSVNETNRATRAPRDSLQLSPWQVLQEARRAVPAVDYALGAAGIAAAGAIVTYFLGKDRAALIIMGGMLIAMLLLYVFARLVAAKSPSVVWAGVALLWMVIVFFGTFLIFTATAFALRMPSAWAELLGIEQAPHPGNQETDAPAQYPEMDATKVVAFTLQSTPQEAKPGLREWTRVAPDRWKEVYPDRSFSIYNVIKRISIGDCDGTVVAAPNAPKFQCFIPDRNCDEMSFLFRRLENGNDWSKYVQLENVK